MIKVELANEKVQPERKVTFDFRRPMSTGSQYSEQLFLVATEDKFPSSNIYPVKIDGRTQTVEIRKRDFEALGFTVLIKE